MTWSMSSWGNLLIAEVAMKFIVHVVCRIPWASPVSHLPLLKLCNFPIIQVTSASACDIPPSVSEFNRYHFLAPHLPFRLPLLRYFHVIYTEMSEIKR